ncbi:MAG TPA: hypothetical protein VMT61_08660 [Candidatus Binataceae bacterium]|nr:hypothetical protein [Candidatus Binataceae bacterium]
MGEYPTHPDGVPPHIFELASLAGRQYSERDRKTKEISEYFYLESINQMEETLRISENALLAAQDPDDSAAPRPFEMKGNSFERMGIRNNHAQAANRLSKSRALVYKYALQWHYELQFSGIADDVFSRIRLRVDGAVGTIVPSAVKNLQRFTNI